METPNIGPISPRFGLRRPAPDRRRGRERNKAFEDAVRQAEDETAGEEPTPAIPPALQRGAPNVRREGEDGDLHVDVLA